MFCPRRMHNKRGTSSSCIRDSLWLKITQLSLYICVNTTQFAPKSKPSYLGCTQYITMCPYLHRIFSLIATALFHELDRGFQAIKATVTAGNSWSLYVIFKLPELPTRKTPDLAGTPHHQTQRLAEARLVSQRCGLRVFFFLDGLYAHVRWKPSPSIHSVMVEKLTPHWLKPPTSRLSNQSSTKAWRTRLETQFAVCTRSVTHQVCGDQNASLVGFPRCVLRL